MPQMKVSDKALEVLKEIKKKRKEKTGRAPSYSEIIENMRIK